MPAELRVAVKANLPDILRFSDELVELVELSVPLVRQLRVKPKRRAYAWRFLC